MKVVVIEYIKETPVASYSFSGVGAGLEEVEKREKDYPDRHYEIKQCEK